MYIFSLSQHKKSNNKKRSELGVQDTYSNLPVADGVTVRTGALDHFDLRVDADSVAGKAIANEFRLNRLSESHGASERLKLLTSEMDSQKGVSILGDLESLST